MIWRKIVGMFLCAALLVRVSGAFETDQYNLPPAPLADIGGEVEDYVLENLREAMNELNREIAEKDVSEKRLIYLRSDEAITKKVFNELGAGIIPFTKAQNWLNSHKFKAQPARYKSSYGDSIYRFVPTNYLTISATVKLYGAEFGTDKIAHFFQQGFTYYRKYQNGLKQGLSEADARKKAVRWGEFSEKTYFGTLVSGVYSNGDMVANYAGMKFYENLTHSVKIGELTKPPVFVLKDGFWTLGSTDILKPFITNHFNEALNPSKFSFFLRPTVRRTLRKKACKQWRERFPDLSKQDFENITQKLKLWHGEDYGFSESDNFITIAGVCFDAEARTK
jgi:hypothetical protein